MGDIRGEVVAAERITPRKGMSYGVHLIVDTGREKTSVHLGPEWFIENQDVELQTKDEITVTGSKVSFGGAAVIIAAEVTKGDAVLELRDVKTGIPRWSGWRRR